MREPIFSGGKVGAKPPVSAESAVCASQHPLVTKTMLDVMRSGGNAVDAAIAACLLHATIQQEMTNHAGTVTFLYWEASSRRTYELNSWGTIVPNLAPFRPIPAGRGLYASFGEAPAATIPGFMPGIKAIYERFATKAWDALCEPAIRFADEGYDVGSFEHRAFADAAEFFLYTASGRAHFAPTGHIHQVGDRWRKPELARTMRALAAEGPDHFITGGWARSFVNRANALGWPIEMGHMSAIPPRWGSGLSYRIGGQDITQLSPPQAVGLASAIFLGVLDALEVTSLGHYSESGDALYYAALALRRAVHEIGTINDPEDFENPATVLLSPQFHAHIADLLRRSRPKIDLTEHVRLAAGTPAMAAAGVPTQPAGSCEISVVDSAGNWLQMMNTLQGGGIPGEVVDGVPMVGSTGITSLSSPIGGWLTGGGRLRGISGHTFVMKDGQPVWSLGSPGSPHLSVPQVLLNGLQYRMNPYAAEDAPRLMPMTDDYRVSIESRVTATALTDATRMGIRIEPLPRYDYHMGSFQMSWTNEDGTLSGSAGPRRAGSAGGF